MTALKTHRWWVLTCGLMKDCYAEHYVRVLRVHGGGSVSVINILKSRSGALTM